MDEPPPSGDERDRRATAAPTDEGASQEDEFYRGGTAASVRRTPWRSHPLPGRLGADRPPAWLSIPLVVSGALAGLFVFSTTWDLAGGGLLAVPIASLAGLYVGGGAVLVGAYAWRRTADGTGIA